MAVEDKYVETQTAAGKLAKSIHTNGAETITLVATEEIAAADDNGSVYRLFKSVPSNYIPVQIDILTDGITGATDYELGLYKVGIDGDAVEIDCLMGTQSLASALTRATGQGLGLAGVAIEDVGKTLAELSGQDDPDTSYDIALTANTAGSGAGTVSVVATFAQG